MIPGLDQILSLDGILGGSFKAQGLLQNNSTVPLAALLGVWLIGGRMLRFATGLVPIALIVFMLLGNDPGVKQMMGGGGSGMLDAGITSSSAMSPGSFASQGWFLPACVIGGIFLLGRGRLSFLHILLAILAGAYLLHTRDFRVTSIVTSPSSRVGMVCIAGAAAVFLLLKFFGGRNRYYAPVPLGIQLASMKPIFISGAIGLTGLFGLFLLFQPVLIEKTFPTWRSTFGVWMLCIALYAFNQSLPMKFRRWMMPAFWCVVCLVIGAQLMHTQLFISGPAHSTVLEQF